MQTISVGDVLDNKLPNCGWERLCIYVFRDGDNVLYVGKTEQNIIERIETHLGLTYRAESQIGRLVETNAPNSSDWHIDLLTLEDCSSFVQHHFPANPTLDLDIAERATILEFAPPLNRHLNPQARPLDQKYTQQHTEHLFQVYQKVSNAKR